MKEAVVSVRWVIDHAVPEEPDVAQLASEVVGTRMNAANVEMGGCSQRLASREVPLLLMQRLLLLLLLHYVTP